MNTHLERNNNENLLDTIIQVSCPECRNMINLEMKLEDENTSLHRPLNQVFENMIDDIQHYSFRGMKKCICGKIVASCLTVSAHGITIRK